MSQVAITPLAQRPDLIEQVAAFFAKTWPTHFADRDAVAYITDHARIDAPPLALVALVEDQLVGTVSLRPDWDAVSSTAAAGPWVGGLYVVPTFRHRGIGSLLVTCAARVAWEFGHETVFVATEDPTLYDALGWEEFESIRVAQTRYLILRASKPTPPTSLYEELGGEPTVRALVDRFYDLMDQRSDVTELRDMHARSLKTSREKLFLFLTGWLGGPDLYVERFGHPRLRRRHMPFSIGTVSRDQWLSCMDQALEDVVSDPKIRTQLSDSFAQIADHMRNRRGE